MIPNTWHYGKLNTEETMKRSDCQLLGKERGLNGQSTKDP